MHDGGLQYSRDEAIANNHLVPVGTYQDYIATAAAYLTPLQRLEDQVREQWRQFQEGMDNFRRQASWLVLERYTF